MLFNKNDKAVSPVVATLVLIVVAIIGAAAVGVILGAFGTDVSGQANSGETGKATSQEITVGGSTTVYPIMDTISKTYMKDHNGVKISVSQGGSDAGVAGAGMGSIDVGMSSRYLDDTDNKSFPDLNSYVIGGSAVVFITNAGTPGVASVTTAIKKSDLISAYDTAITGTTTAFADGAVMVQRTEASGTEETVAKWLFSASNLDNAAADTTTLHTTTHANKIGNQGVLDYIGATPKAVGFVDYGYAKDAATTVTMLKVDPEVTTGTYTPVAVDDSHVKAGVIARLSGTEKTVAGVTYYPVELCRPLMLVVKGTPSSTVKAFVEYCQSTAAMDAFTQNGVWSINALKR